MRKRTGTNPKSNCRLIDAVACEAWKMSNLKGANASGVAALILRVRTRTPRMLGVGFAVKKWRSCCCHFCACSFVQTRHKMFVAALAFISIGLARTFWAECSLKPQNAIATFSQGFVSVLQMPFTFRREGLHKEIKGFAALEARGFKAIAPPPNSV